MKLCLRKWENREKRKEKQIEKPTILKRRQKEKVMCKIYRCNPVSFNFHTAILCCVSVIYFFLSSFYSMALVSCAFDTFSLNNNNNNNKQRPFRFSIFHLPWACKHTWTSWFYFFFFVHHIAQSTLCSVLVQSDFIYTRVSTMLFFSVPPFSFLI